MNCVGIDVSKGKSMIAVMRPFGEVVVSPFEVRHTASELSELARLLKNLDGETRVVMESTGNYHAPVAWLLHGAGFYVSVVNAMLVHDYGNNSLRRGKTDKKDAVKLANYGLDHWLTLPRYVPEEDTRLMLKTCYRQYQQYSKVQTMLTHDSPVGWKGERTRLFLSDKGYEKALDSQAKGQIKILSHAKVRNGDLLYDRSEQIR